MKWISVKDKLPLDEQDVLVWTDDEICETRTYYTKHDDNGCHFLNWEFCSGGTVTHWMSLPEGPK